MTAPDLDAASLAIDAADAVVRAGIAQLARHGSVDEDQVLAYDLAHAASAVATARSMLDYGNKGDVEARLTCAFVADAVADLAAKLFGREQHWGVQADALDATREFVSAFRSPEFLAELADAAGPRHLDDDFEMVQDTFRRFAEDKIRPVAEHIHRHNDDIPEEIISGLA